MLPIENKQGGEYETEEEDIRKDRTSTSKSNILEMVQGRGESRDGRKHWQGENGSMCQTECRDSSTGG